MTAKFVTGVDIENVIKPNNHPTHKGLRKHGTWLLLLTFIILALFIWEDFVKPKKDNYTDLWRTVSWLETRIKSLEDKIE